MSGSVSKQAPPARVLFALAWSERPSAALRSASSIAESMRAELHLVQWLPRIEVAAACADGPLDFVEARRRSERCLAVCRQTRAWCEDTLGEPLPLRRLRIRFGPPTEAVAQRAAELDARLVVVAPATEPVGTLAIRVAARCSRPVLVARGFPATGAISAATDRESDGGDGARDPLDAILDEVQRYGSRLIVMGTRSRVAARSGSSAAAGVIDRSSCSVVVRAITA